MNTADHSCNLDPGKETVKNNVLWRRLARLACAVVFFALSSAVSANTCSPATTAGAAPSDWRTYCWLDFTGYVDATAAGGQPFSFTLPDGATLTFTLTRTAGAYTAIAAPAWTGAAVGNTSFLGIPGKPILYTTVAGTGSFTFSNMVFTPPGGGPATYYFVATDGESTNSGESLSFTTDGTSWTQVDTVAPISGAYFPTPSFSNGGYTATETGTSDADAGAYVWSTQSPGVLTTNTVAGGLQGAMFAVRWGNVSATKVITTSRVNPADQFTYSVTASTNHLLASQTTTGTGLGPFALANGVVTSGGYYVTVAEAMAAGSVSSLATNYRSSYACTNSSSGGTAPPSGTGTSVRFGPLVYGDAIACTFTNVPITPVVTVTKALSGSRINAADQFTVEILNAGTPVSQATTTGSGATVSTGSTGPIPVTAGTTYTINEVMAAGTSKLSQYAQTLACTNAASGSTTVLPTALGQGFSPNTNDIITCTLTNSAKAPTLTVTKAIQGRTLATDQFTVAISNGGPSATTTGTATTASAGPYTALAGTAYTFSETGAGTPAANLGTYLSSYSCTNTLAGGTVVASGTGTSVAITPANGDAITCAFTNTGAQNVVVNKTVDSPTHTVGDIVTWTITAKNTSAVATTGVINLVDTLPSNVTGIAVTGPGCPAGPFTAGGSVTCVVPSGLAAGSTATVSITATATTAGTLSNTVTANGAGPPSCGNCTATTTVSATGVQVSKTVDAATHSIGATVTWTLIAKNTGTEATKGAINLLDQLPANISTITVTGTGCPAGPFSAGSSFTCVVPAGLAAGASATVTVTAKTTVAGTLTNTVTPTGTDAVSCLPGACAVSTLVVAPQVAVTKTADRSTQVVGGSLIWTITAQNNGNGPTLGIVTLTDTLPANVSGITVSSSGATCSAAPYTPGSTLVCTVPAGLAAAAQATVTVTATTTAVGNVTNTVVPSGPDGPTCANAAACAPVSTVEAPSIVVTKTVDQANHNLADTITWTITAQNTGSGPTTGPVVLTDTLPASVTNITVAGPGCPSGPFTAGGTVTCSATLNAGASASVVITAKATSAGVSLTNTVAATGPDHPTCNTCSATTTIATAPTLTKTFAPTSIAPGSTSTLTLSLGNSNGTAATLSSALTDTLPAGLTVATPSTVGGTCTLASVTATAGSGTITYGSGASIAAGGCTITVAVTSTTAGTVTNTIAAGGLATNQGSNASAASAALTVYTAPTLAKSFAPATVISGGTSTLTLSLGNSNSSAATLSAALSDALPTGMTVASPAVIGGTCSAASVTALAGSGTISFANGASIPSGGCTITVAVTSTTPGPAVNTVAAQALKTNQGNSPTAATATLTVAAAAPTLAKSFSPAGIVSGGTSTLTLSLGNSNSTAATLTSALTDTLPSGMTVASPAAIGGTCTLASVTATAGAATITYASGASIPAGGCTITVSVTSATPGTATNTLAAGALATTFGTTASAASANLVVTALAPTLAKAFAPTSIVSGGTSTLTLSLGNGNATAATLSAALTDNLPAGMTIATPAAIGGTCSAASVTATAGQGSLGYASGASIPAGGCTITVAVTSTTPGTATNTIAAGALQTSFGNSAAAASAALAVTAAAPTLSKSFAPAAITAGASSTLTLSLGNSNATSATLTTTLADTLPAGMTVASPATIGGTCTTASVTATAGSSTVSYASGATVAAGGCTITVNVTSATPGAAINTLAIGALQTSLGSNAAAASATLTVNAAAPTLTKSFAPVSIASGGTSTLTLALGNTNATPAVLSTALTDTLPAGMTVATPAAIGGTCTLASVTATAGSGTIIYASGSSVPAGGCTITVGVTSKTPGTATNTVAAGALATSEGSNALPATATLSVAAGAPTLAKTFNPAAITSGSSSTLTLTLGNSNATAAVLSAALTDTLPAGMTVATPPGIGGTCTLASVTAVAGAGTLTYANGASVPAGGCTITVGVTSATPGTATNTLAAGALQTSQGANASAASASLAVAAATPTLSKSFTPATITSGGTSTLLLTLGNGNATAATLSAALTDTLPAGMTIASPAVIGGSCTAAAVTAAAGAGTITYASGASVPPGGCTISVGVTSKTPGAATNTVAAGALRTSQGNSPAAATATLNVTAALPTVTKSFAPASITSGGTSTLTLNLGNPNATAVTLTGALTDTLPTGMTVASPASLAGTCTLALASATAGSSTVGYASGATIPAGGCAITVVVTSSTPGAATNTIAAGALTTSAGSNATPATATLTVTALPPTLAKSFTPSTITSGAASSLTLSLGNPNATAAVLTAALTDPLPAGMTIANPAGIGGTCPAASVTAVAGASTLGYASGATVPAGGCTIVVSVVSATPGVATNSIAAGALQTNLGNSPTAASAALTVNAAAPTLSKSFAPASIVSGGTSSLTLTLGNPNATAATLTAILTDTLPAGMTVATPAAISGTCPAGSVTATAGAGTISYANGATLPAAGCTLIVGVTSATPGASTNTVAAGALRTSLGANPSAASALLTVTATPPTLTKTFAPASIVSGGTATLRLALGNGNAVPAVLTANLTDNLPAGVTIATPNGLSTTCTAAAVTAVSGSSAVSYASGASIPSGGCSISVSVTSITPGVAVNSIAAGSLATNLGSAGAASANLSVTAAPPTLVKSFAPATITAGSTTTLRLVLGNSNSTATSLTAALIDTLPAGMAIAAPNNLSSTCTAASVTATPGSGTLSYASGAQLPAGGCSIAVSVVSNLPGISTNSLPAGALATGFGTAGAASATLTVNAAVPTLTKAFSPTSMASGSTSTLVLILGNSNASTATLTATLVDSLPTGMTIAAPSALSTTCTAASVLATPGAAQLSYASGAAIPAAGCEISVAVTSTTPGVATNSIPANALVTNFGAAAATSAALTVTAAPPTLTESFAPASISAGATSTLTLVLGNPDALSSTLTHVFTDTLPAGMTIASPNSLATTCGAASVTAVSGSGAISLASGAALPAGGCTISVSVTSLTPGVAVNAIPAGNLTTNFGAAPAATASLSVTSTPDLGLTKTGPASLVIGQSANFTLTVSNLGVVPVASATVKDVLPTGVQFNGASGAACAAAAQTLTCTATGPIAVGQSVSFTVNVTASPLAGASVTNIAAVDPSGGANPPTPGTLCTPRTACASVTTPVLAAQADLALQKTGPSVVAAQSGLTYTLTIANNGPAAANNASFSDPLPAGLSAVSASCGNPQGGAACGTVQLAGTVVTGTASLLPAGGSVAITIRATAPASGTFTNTATVSPPAGVTDPNAANNTSSVTTSVGAVPTQADLSVTNIGTGTVQVGHPVRYVVTLENAGPDAANGALFADPIPAALTGVTWSCVAQGGAVCPQANGAGNALSQTIANFPSGGELTYTITALAPATAQTLSSTATINPPTGITDPNLANNTSTVRTAVTTTAPSGADLAISKVGPATIGPKQTVTYSIVVLNNGPNAANGAVVSDAVPSALTNVTATCSATGGALCQLPIAPGNNVNATIALLPAGGSATVTITGTSPQTGTFTNVATVTPPAGVDDPNPGNNVSGAVETAVVSAAVSGSVWVDYNLNHRRDPNEPGVPGFTVQLLANGIVVASTTTDANGQYSIANVPPGVYALRFVDPASGAVFGTPVNGENGAPNPDSNAVIGDGIIESITLKPGINIVQQSLPVDPTGIIYDSVTRQALGGATVTLVGPPGFNPATGLVGGAANVSQVTGASGVAAGFFQFLLVNLGAPGGAPAGTYTIEVKPPAGYLPPNATQGGVEPPQGTFAVPGPIGSESAIQPQPTPPPVGSNGVNTRYYFKLLFSAASGAVVNDDIPLDHASGGALTVQKTGSLSEANIGDAVLYTVLVQSAQASLSNVTVTDTLPRGFTYIKGTATVNNARVPDPVGSPGPSLSFVVGAVSPSSPATITYRVRIGVGAQQGDGVNHARASTPGGASSNVATFRVKVGGGVFTTEACVIGKVYVDCNGNRIQDPGEPGIPGVRLYFSDGTFVVTDSEGKYSYCGLPATTHTLKVDRATLPPGAEMVVSSNRNALDPMSLFIDLKNGELHQADFIEGSCSKSVIHAVDERRGRDEVDAPASEKGPSPALHFESKPISNPNSQGVLP